MRVFIVMACLVSACTTEAETGDEHAILPGRSDSGIVLRDTCAASEFGPKALIGRRAESIPFEDYPFPVRIVAPGMAVTMDYSDARLTVETDAQGVIMRAQCG
jgi:hypothetical protein